MNKYFLILFVSAMLYSCELDRFPYDQIEQSQSFQTIKDAKSYETGFYSKFRGTQYGIYQYISDIQSDLLNACLDYGNRRGFPHRWTPFLASDYDLRDMWKEQYNGIININNFIDNYNSITIENEDEQAILNQILGTGYFFRAFYYYNLSDRFCKDYEKVSSNTDFGLPLVLNFDVELKPSRSSLEATYTQILNDLAEAAKLINLEGSINSPFVTKDCVDALFARIYLSMDNYELAAEYSKKFINHPKYVFANNLEKLKSFWHEDAGSETIFQLAVFSPSELPLKNECYLGYNSANGKYSPDFIPEEWIIELFEEEDFRKEVYFKNLPCRIQGTDYELTLVNKYPGNPELFTSGSTNYAHAPKVLRLAEMYLINAEANAKLNGKESDAMTALNEIRINRGLEVLPNLSGDDLFQEIKNERTREFAFEGKRLDDLERWKMPMIRKTPQNLDVIVKGNEYHTLTKEVGDPKFVWGIPANDITTNPNIKNEQNPGW